MDIPIKKKRTAIVQAAALGPLPELPAGLMDHLVKGPMTSSEAQAFLAENYGTEVSPDFISSAIDEVAFRTIA